MLKNRVISTTFIISLISHGLFLGAPIFNITAPRLERPKELTLQIEIEKPLRLPRIERMGEEKKLREVLKDVKPEPQKRAEEVALHSADLPPVEEKIEVLNPADEAMLRYQDMVKQRIEAAKRYPEWAKEQGLGGIAHLEFVILANGSGQEIKLIHSSGSEILDEEAITTIKRASPFPPLPKEIAKSFIQIEISLVFTLKE